MITTSLKLNTAPAAELLTTAEAKTHLRVSGSSEDTYIDSLVVVARQLIEEYTSRALITQTWDQVYDTLPYDMRYIELGRGPVQSITHLKYYIDDVETTFSSSLYSLDDSSTFPRLYLEPDESWPSLDAKPNAVSVRFIAGYGNAASDVPEPIIQAARLLVGWMYENRDDRVTNPNVKTASMPIAVSYLLKPYRLWGF